MTHRQRTYFYCCTLRQRTYF